MVWLLLLIQVLLINSNYIKESVFSTLRKEVGFPFSQGEAFLFKEALYG